MKNPSLLVIGVNAATIGVVLLVLGAAVIDDPSLSFIGAAVLMYSVVLVTIGYGLEEKPDPGITIRVLEAAYSLLGEPAGIEAAGTGKAIKLLYGGRSAEIQCPEELCDNDIELAEALGIMVERYDAAARVEVAGTGRELRITFHEPSRAYLWRTRLLSIYTLLSLAAAACRWGRARARVARYDEEAVVVEVEAGER